MGFPRGSVVNKMPVIQEAQEMYVWSLGQEDSNPLQYSCLENPRDREAWRPAVYRVAKSQTRHQQLNTHTHMLLYKCHADNTCLGNFPGLLSTLPTLLLWDWPYSLLDFGCLTWLSEKAMATHSSTLAWEIPSMTEPGKLQSMGWRRVGHEWANLFSLFTFMHWRRKWQTTPVLLPGESWGQRSLVGCRLWGAVYGVS